MNDTIRHLKHLNLKRRSILNRDGHCLICGSTKRLHLHHIIPFAYGLEYLQPEVLNNSINKVALCEDCHRYYEGKRRSYLADPRIRTLELTLLATLIQKMPSYPSQFKQYEFENANKWFPIGYAFEGSFTLAKLPFHCQCRKMRKLGFVCQHTKIMPFEYYIKIGFGGDRKRLVKRLSLECAEALGYIPQELVFCEYRKHKFETVRIDDTTVRGKCISCGYELNYYSPVKKGDLLLGAWTGRVVQN